MTMLTAPARDQSTKLTLLITAGTRPSCRELQLNRSLAMQSRNRAHLEPNHRDLQLQNLRDPHEAPSSVQRVLKLLLIQTQVLQEWVTTTWRALRPRWFVRPLSRSSVRMEVQSWAFLGKKVKSSLFLTRPMRAAARSNRFFYPFSKSNFSCYILAQGMSENFNSCERRLVLWSVFITIFA